MARFVLIDHSVTSPGGHNFEHANDVLHAAETLGYEPVLAANQAIVKNDDLPASWRILPLFPDCWDPLHWIGPDGRSEHPFDIDGNLLAPLPGDARPRGLFNSARDRYAKIRDGIRFRERRKSIVRFADACTQLWQAVRPCAEDRILLPSVTEFDLLGLVRFLMSEPESQQVDWHLLFHFNLFAGRTPSYDAQTVVRDRFRRQFATALAHVPNHRLHFHGITDLVAQQYNRLGTATFTELPYTINGGIKASSATQDDRPLRLTCPGVIRREKGKRQIRDLVRRLWNDHLAAGSAQLFFQGRARDLRRFFPKETLAHSTFVETPDVATDAPVVIVRHPLNATDYARLIRDSHIGLFLHDSERYFARCSGTLVELLGAGVPVIVPAGCWLAEKIAEPVNEHLNHLVLSDAVMAKSVDREITWTPPARSEIADPHHFELSFGAGANAASCEIPIPRGTVDAVLSCSFASGTCPGHYVRVAAVLMDEDGRCVADHQVSIVGASSGGKNTSTLFSLGKSAATLRLTLANAYNDSLLTANHLQIAFLGKNKRYPFGFPGGQIGLIAADLSQFSRLLRDMTQHYAHYRRSAIAFSHAWSRQHSAAAVINRINTASASESHGEDRNAAA